LTLHGITRAVLAADVYVEVATMTSAEFATAAAPKDGESFQACMHRIDAELRFAAIAIRQTVEVLIASAALFDDSFASELRAASRQAGATLQASAGGRSGPAKAEPNRRVRKALVAALLV
jgi:hypothetical protein